MLSSLLFFQFSSGSIFNCFLCISFFLGFGCFSSLFRVFGFLEDCTRSSGCFLLLSKSSNLNGMFSSFRFCCSFQCIFNSFLFGYLCGFKCSVFRFLIF